MATRSSSSSSAPAPAPVPTAHQISPRAAVPSLGEVEQLVKYPMGLVPWDSLGAIVVFIL